MAVASSHEPSYDVVAASKSHMCAEEGKGLERLFLLSTAVLEHTTFDLSLCMRSAQFWAQEDNLSVYLVL